MELLNKTEFFKKMFLTLKVQVKKAVKLLAI